MPVVLLEEPEPHIQTKFESYKFVMRKSADYMIMCFKAFNHMLEVLERAVGINTITFVQILP